MKECNRCRETKDWDSFGNNKTKPDGKQGSCRECVKTYNANYYKKTPEKNPARIANNLRRKMELQRYVWDYLKLNPCVDCGESDPVVLEFDHVRDTKLFNISDYNRTLFSVQKLQSEIDKCDVRCANCHRRVTASRGGWYSGIIEYTPS